MILKLFLLGALSVSFCYQRFFQDSGSLEKSKIEFLLKEAEKLQGAKFWRNGTSHSSTDAANHLRMKWKKAGGTVKTAKDFIDKIASQSSISGEPYQIEFADGTKVKTSVFFYRKLASWKP